MTTQVSNQVSKLTSFARRSPRRIRIVLVDDHPIVLAGLTTLFSSERDFVVMSQCVKGSEALRAVMVHRPDVLVVDQDMPVIDGVAVLKQLRRAGDQTPVVLMATANDQKLTDALSLGVEGIVFKRSDPRQLIRCLREVGAGRKYLDVNLNVHHEVNANGQMLGGLTRRQIEVAQAAVSGLSNKELASRLGVSEGTIKNHLHAIYERLRLNGRLALLLYLKEKALA